MTEYRYLALKINCDENGKESIDEDFEVIEFSQLSDSPDDVRINGNTQLLKKHPDLTLDDFSISVSLK